MKSLTFFAVTLFCIRLCCQTISGQDGLKPGRLPSDIRKSLVPGLLTEFLSADGAVVDSQINRLPALTVSEGENLSPFVADRKVSIRYVGYLKLKLKGAHVLSLQGRGRIHWALNDAVVFSGSGDLAELGKKSVELVKGYNRFELLYEPPGDGDPLLRAYWESDSFAREPIPSTFFLTARDHLKTVQAEVVDHHQLHAGRDLFLRHHCQRCHTATDGSHEIFTSPRGPDLAVSADLATAGWLKEWLLDPAKMRNDTTMPHLLEGSEQPERDADDLIAFLLSRRDRRETDAMGGDAEIGGEIFENLGCIGCHHFETPDHEDEYQRVSLHHAAVKFRPGKLALFLKDSRAHSPWSRMPQFRIDPEQAGHLEAFLREAATAELKAKSSDRSAQEAPGNVKRGEQLFDSVGCANCHPVGELRSGTLRALPLDACKSDRGCLSAVETRQPGSKAMHYPFSAEQTAALQLFVAGRHARSLERPNLGYLASRMIRELRCTTCHDLDDIQATLPYIIEEEGVVGLPPNRVPMLTWAGEKLLPQWSEQLIRGKLPYRVREHFRVQMPGFPQRGQWIAEGLSRVHGFDPHENQTLKLDAGKVSSGRAVAAMETGLSCNRCHAIGDQKPNAAFDAQSTNLVYAARRLRREYYLRWMFDPLRIDRQTKMPKFSEDGRSTSLKSVLGGDASRQFDAVWHYLNSIKAKD
ncbi:MAG: cytochrome c [Planctomycetota bacterium]|nr:cytochrome c [Planctomycetota bacterium]